MFAVICFITKKTVNNGIFLISSSPFKLILSSFYYFVPKWTIYAHIGYKMCTINKKFSNGYVHDDFYISLTINDITILITNSYFIKFFLPITFKSKPIYDLKYKCLFNSIILCNLVIFWN